MTRYATSLRIAAAMVALALSFGSSLNGQVGKGTILDANTAVEKDLLALPNMTPAIVKGLLDEAAVRERRRAEHVSARPEADAGAGGGVLRQGVRAREPEYRHARGDPADPGRGRTHGPRVRRISAVEDLGAVRQGDRQVRRAARDRSPEAVRLHSRQPQHGDRRGHPEHPRRRRSAWCASSRNTGRGRRRSSSTRRSASTSARRKRRGSGVMS